MKRAAVLAALLLCGCAGAPTADRSWYCSRCALRARTCDGAHRPFALEARQRVVPLAGVAPALAP